MEKKPAVHRIPFQDLGLAEGLTMQGLSRSNSITQNEVQHIR